MDSEPSSNSARKGDNPHNLSVNASIFREWRTPQAEELELSMWTLKMLESAVALDYEQYGALKTAIHRGVPDILKPYVWIKANEADKFYKSHPNFYETCLESTFGNHMPATLSEQCPTFCGGLMGFEQDLYEQSDSNDIGKAELSTQDYDPGPTADRYDNMDCSSNISETGKQHHNISIYAPDSTNLDGKNNEQYVEGTDGKGGTYHSPKSLTNPHVNDNSKSADDKVDKTDSGDINSFIKERVEPHRVPRNVFRMKGPERMREMSSIFVSRESSISNVPRRSFIRSLFKRKKMDENLVGIGHRHLSEPLIEISGKYNLPPLATHLSHLQHKTLDGIKLKEIKNNRPTYNRQGNSIAAGSDCGSNSSCGAYYGSVHESENEDVKKMLWFSNLARIDSDSNVHEGQNRCASNFFRRFYRILCCRAHSANNDVLHKIYKRIGSSDRDKCTATELLNIDIAKIDTDKLKEPVSPGPVSGQQQFLQLVATREKVQQNIKTSVYNLQDVTDFCILLTPIGIEQVKRILWCLNTSYSSKVEYMPMIPTLCCVLLVYLIPEVVICVLYKLLKRATEQTNDLFVACSRVEFIYLVKTCYSKAKMLNNVAISYLEKLGVDLLAWISRVIQRGFTFILPFDHILRILGAYLFQGDEILCRYILSILKLLQPELLKCCDKESADQVLYYAGLRSNPNLDEITKIAYNFRLSFRRPNSAEKLDVDHQTSYLRPIGIKLFYRPRLNHVSEIVKVHEWEELWTWMNDSYRILDPEMLYCSTTDGYNMFSLIRKFEALRTDSIPALLFIQTYALDTIGVFIPQLCKFPKDGIYTHNALDRESFVFTCKPMFQAYSWMDKGGPSITQECIKVGLNG